jgi:hypothetical protein
MSKGEPVLQGTLVIFRNAQESQIKFLTLSNVEDLLAKL